MQNILVQSKNSKQLSKILEEFSESNVDLSETNLELSESFVSNVEKKIIFSKDHYTRTCIYKNKSVEVLILAWDSGQVTDIHNHLGHNCYWKVLNGNIVERTFEWDETTKQLEYKEEKSLTEGDFGFDDNKTFFHQIINNSDEPAITLHIYSRPLETCSVFDSENKKLISKELQNDFERFDLFKALIHQEMST